MREKLIDCLVIGAGPAGLIAATYLARFMRDVLVLHGGASRASLIPLSHNAPGYPDGISGPALLRALDQQALKFGASIVNDGYHRPRPPICGTMQTKAIAVATEATRQLGGKYSAEYRPEGVRVSLTARV
jgi:thioredoxin reductase